ncbi:MAG: AbrB/MazE/SpoVT family DNA-binding domain-containing protein [bacterium]
MRSKAVVSERGTVTLPHPVRKAAHIKPGDLVEFELKREVVILRRLIVKRAEEVFMSDDKWKEFNKLVKKQIEAKECTLYEDLEEAKGHSERLSR